MVIRSSESVKKSIHNRASLVTSQSTQMAVSAGAASNSYGAVLKDIYSANFESPIST